MLLSVFAAFGGAILFAVLGIVVVGIVLSLARWLLALFISFDEEEE